MHRHWLQRVFAIVMVIWFTALVVEPVMLHPCPMHDGLLAMSTAGAMPHHMGAMADLRGQAMMHVEHHGSPSDPGSTGHHCTCIGTCTAASTGGMVATRLTLASALITRPRDPGLPDYAYIPVTAQHVLPFPHGPPLSPRAL